MINFNEEMLNKLKDALKKSSEFVQKISLGDGGLYEENVKLKEIIDEQQEKINDLQAQINDENIYKKLYELELKSSEEYAWLAREQAEFCDTAFDLIRDIDKQLRPEEY